MTVKCTVPVRLYGEFAGEYERDAIYPDDRLAAVAPKHFESVPDIGTREPVRAAECPDDGTPPDTPTESKTKRRK